ncbi:MAG: hypothetical protein CM1200mP3_18580 [Chloroflexota bacterium]|nr:MAG: hypothetical protein CM1200mP3_18580 [Chloroflexota bacterium]
MPRLAIPVLLLHPMVPTGALKTTLIFPKKVIFARGKLAQAVVYGAHIAMIDGNFDDALSIARQLCERNSIELVNSINPNRIEGQKTAAFEIIV